MSSLFILFQIAEYVGVFAFSWRWDFISPSVCIYDNLSNSSSKDAIQLVEKGADFVKGDILDYEHLKESCIGFDVIIHLAAISDVKNSH